MIDQVNFVFRTEAEAIEATGQCEAEDLTTWQASVTCAATTAKGRFKAGFSSTGGAGYPVFNVPDVGGTPK